MVMESLRKLTVPFVARAPNDAVRAFHEAWHGYFTGHDVPLGSLLATVHAAADIDRAQLARRVTLAVARTWTVENLLPLLPVMGAFYGLDVTTSLRPFGVLRQELLDPASPVYRERSDALVLLWQFEDFLPDAHDAWSWATPTATGRVQDVAEDVAGLLRVAARNYAGLILAFDFGLDPRGPVQGVLESTWPTAPHRVRQRVNHELRAALEGDADPRVTLLDLAKLQFRVGVARWADDRTRLTAHCPLSPRAVLAVFDEILCAVAARGAAPRKALVLDADGILWGGILAEDGADGIALSADYPGNVFVEIQKRILELHHQGVALALCSKNEERSVRAVFETHPAMILKPGHIAAWAVNWRPKSENIGEIAARLNLGLDALVFVDDSPREREEVRQRCPGVLVPDVPAAPVELHAFWMGFNPFPRAALSAEDRLRSRDYAAENERHRARAAAVTLEDFYRNLDMRAVTRTAGERDVARVAQMSQRTNQFNATTVRMTESDVNALLRAGNLEIHLLELTDRLGESGVVGCAVARLEPDRVVIEQFMMSCRVLKRTVEHEFLCRIMRRYLGARDRLAVRYVPSPRNEMVLAFLRELGAPRQVEDGWVCEIPITDERIAGLKQPWID